MFNVRNIARIVNCQMTGLLGVGGIPDSQTQIPEITLKSPKNQTKMFTNSPPFNEGLPKRWGVCHLGKTPNNPVNLFEGVPQLDANVCGR